MLPAKETAVKGSMLADGKRPNTLLANCFSQRTSFDHADAACLYSSHKSEVG